MKTARGTANAGQDLYARAKTLIPGGTQLLSKRPEMFAPGCWPPYYRRAKGIEVEDLDGNSYRDFSLMGVGAAVLGYADPDVDAAVRRAIEDGVVCTLNAPEEVELADLLLELHPWAQMVRYARAGGEAMAIAVRIARAHTGRERVAFCGYHGWMDWYLAANLEGGDALDGHLLPGLEPDGVPPSLRGTAVPFHYNRLDQLETIVDAHRDDLAAIVMEPQRSQQPDPGFLEGVRDIATRIGAVLVFDEITSGFRMTTGGIHLLLGVNPDMAVFAKGMANGYAMAAVVGVEQVMGAAQSTFISSTNWTERIGSAAALATIRKHRAESVADHLKMAGRAVTQTWQRAATEVGLPIATGGLQSLAHFWLEGDEQGELLTLFRQLMLDAGFLASDQFKPSFAHRLADIEDYKKAAEWAFAEVAEARRAGNIGSRLRGAPARRGFFRLV